MTKYILGIDIGTSSTKAILMTTNGQIISQTKESYSYQIPHPGWAESNANDWFDAVIKSSQTLSKNVDSNQIIAVGIDGLYSGSGIPVDKSGKVLGPTLIWMDRRATKEAKAVNHLIDQQALLKKTANIADPYYGYTKIMWIKNNCPNLYQKTYKFLPPESYVIYQLTGQESINYSAAGNLSGIFDIHKKVWSKSFADKLGIDINKLPQRFINSTTIAGRINKDWAHKLGLNNGIPIYNTGVDVGPATVGTGIFKPGKITVAAGTSMSAALVTTKPLIKNRLIIWPYPYKSDKYYYNFAGANTAGAIIAWFAREFASDLSKNDAPKALDKKSKNIPSGSNGVLVLPYFMGERTPLWDSNVRGTILGISLNTTKYELYNAFLEAVAYSIRNSIEQFSNIDIGDSFTLVGGISHSQRMLHIISDVTGKKVYTTKSGGEANLGSAILAGIGNGDIEAKNVNKWIKIDQEILPNAKNHKVYNRCFEMYKSAYQHVKSFYQKYSSSEH